MTTMTLSFGVDVIIRNDATSVITTIVVVERHFIVVVSGVATVVFPMETTCGVNLGF